MLTFPQLDNEEQKQKQPQEQAAAASSAAASSASSALPSPSTSGPAAPTLSLLFAPTQITTTPAVPSIHSPQRHQVRIKQEPKSPVMQSSGTTQPSSALSVASVRQFVAAALVPTHPAVISSVATAEPPTLSQAASASTRNPLQPKRGHMMLSSLSQTPISDTAASAAHQPIDTEQQPTSIAVTSTSSKRKRQTATPTDNAQLSDTSSISSSSKKKPKKMNISSNSSEKDKDNHPPNAVNADSTSSTAGAKKPRKQQQARKQAPQQQGTDELMDLSSASPQKQVTFRDAASFITGGSSTASDNTGTKCALCSEQYTMEGLHRLCSLKCGHVLGYSCATRWIDQYHQCPQCKSKASVNDIRKLLVVGMSLKETAELAAAHEREAQLKHQVLKLQSAKEALEEALVKERQKHEQLNVSYQRLQAKLLESGGSGSRQHNTNTFLLNPMIQFQPTNLAASAQSTAAAAAAAATASASASASASFNLNPQFQRQPPSFASAIPSYQHPAAASAVTLADTPLYLLQQQSHQQYSPQLASFQQSQQSQLQRHQVHSSSSSLSMTSPFFPSHVPNMLPSSSRPTPQSSARSETASSSTQSPRLLPPKPQQSVGSPRSYSALNEHLFPPLGHIAVDNSRCFDFDDTKGNLLLSSQPTNYPTMNDLTNGVIMSHVEHTQTRHYMPLHSKAMRDLHFDPMKQLLLTCAFDKTVKIASIAQGSIVAQIELASPVWSCQWSSWNEQLLHCGLQTGEMVTYDRRQLASPLVTLSLPSKQPVHSILSIGRTGDAVDSTRGVLASTSSHVTMFKSASNAAMGWDCIQLPVSPIAGTSSGSIAYDPASGTCVCAVRPSSVADSSSKPLNSPMCTVFRLDQVNSLSSSASLTPRFRWSLPLHSNQHVQLDYSHQHQQAGIGSSLECRCLGQLTGHQQHMAFTRADVWSYESAASVNKATQNANGRRVLVACGDEDSKQCVVWESSTERVLSRLNGQPAPIIQVRRSSNMNILVTLSTSACCLYADAVMKQE